MELTVSCRCHIGRLWRGHRDKEVVGSGRLDLSGRKQKGKQYRRPFNPCGVDNPSLEDGIHQQEHHNLLEDHPLDNDPHSTHMGCEGESRPQGWEEKGLEDPGLVD